jgi:superfamily II DNA/RNA helicase
VRTELGRDHQAYFVYPRIEEGDDSLKAAERMGRLLAEEIYPEFSVALIHSRVSEEEKKERMEAFSRGELQVLVSTSVVEVGVDVPNATCMIIEHAERFGLAGLHQLRGRVGRGEAQSYAFLVYSDELSEEGKRRLMIMKESSDGFRIAEEDLKLRGPGAGRHPAVRLPPFQVRRSDNGHRAGGTGETGRLRTGQGGSRAAAARTRQPPGGDGQLSALLGRALFRGLTTEIGGRQ